MDVKIYIVYHKNCHIFRSKYLIPICVGKKVNGTKLEMLGDDTLDNISNKNPNYCELTALYWIWKNDNSHDYIGLFHYRRVLTDEISFKDEIMNKVKFIKFMIKRVVKDNEVIGYQPLYVTDNINVAQNKITRYEKFLNKIDKYDVVLPKKDKCNLSMEFQYYCGHIREDFIIFEEIIKAKYPEFYEWFEIYKKKNISYSYNMFIMKKIYFNLYMEMLFDILFEVEKKNFISQYPYQARVFGFLAERLMLPFIMYIKSKYNIKIKEQNVLLINGI